MRAAIAVVRRMALPLVLLLHPGRAEAGDYATSPDDPMISIHDGFVDEKECGSCHQDEAAAFAKSHHARAMAVASDATVRAVFDGAGFEHDGILTTFAKRDGRYFVRTEDAAGSQAEFEVKYTFGYEPLQQYLVDMGGGRLQALDIAWDTDKARWFWLGLGKPQRPGTTYHWTGPFYRWNRTCIDCHSTDPRANFQPESGQYGSTYVATSIGCQSCHGGGAQHVKWAKAGGLESSADVGLVPAGPEVCLGCHARRTKLREGFGPGKAFLDYFSPDLWRPDLYFPDGQILDEVFEYGSFLQSKMARAGVVCLDCHKPHASSLKAEGNAVCTQCHTEAKPDRFTGFDPSGNFDTFEHTHHAVGTEGARCANCHMPQRVYMKVDPRRDHAFVIPRPDLSITYGTPNACTTCHADRNDAWAAETMDDWYGRGWRDRPSKAHAFELAALDDPAAIQALRTLVADHAQPALVKAGAIAEMGRLGGEAVAADIAAAAADADPLVRVGAAQAAGGLPPSLQMGVAGKLLADTSRAVRVSAVTSLSTAPTADLPGDQRRAFDSAVEDLRDYVQANADMAEAQNTFGVFMMAQQRLDEAEAALRRATALDPSLAGAQANLAELYRTTGRDDRSESTYAQAVKVSPEDAMLRYGHALSLVRMKDMDAAIAELQMSVELEPANVQYRTTWAVALDSVGRTDEAFDMLRKAIDSGAPDAALIDAGVRYGLKLKRYAETLELAEKLAALQPDNRPLADLINQLRAAR